MSEQTEYQAESYLPEPAERPCVLVVFGGAGALAQRKLAPALYNLAQDRLLPRAFALLGVARTARTDREYRGILRAAIHEHSRRPPRTDLLERLLGAVHYQALRPGQRADWTELVHRLEEIDARHGTAGCRLLYLATPPQAYAGILAGLHGCGLADKDAGQSATRIVIEKPFGTDRPSAAELNRRLAGWFDEEAIYRIDHFLGKETVQNLLVFRFSNAIFEPLLSNRHVHDVQITVAEDAGVGERGNYYDTTGALRDMVQNHLLQLLCLVAMDPPQGMDLPCVRAQKVKVLRAIASLTAEEAARQVVRGQYKAGEAMNGYRDEPGVAADSQTETFVALRLEVRNARWAGVPFYLRTGKRLARRVSQIVVTFKREKPLLFSPEHCDWRSPNRLIFRLQPAGGISIAFDAKAPGPRLLLRPVRMDFDYERSFDVPGPEAYERLLLDALKGQMCLFAGAHEVDESWRIVDSIRAAWEQPGTCPLREYPCGSWGPYQAAAIFTDQETSWQTT